MFKGPPTVDTGKRGGFSCSSHTFNSLPAAILDPKFTESADSAPVGQMYLWEVLRACRARGISVRYSPDPIFPDRIDALELLEGQTALILVKSGEEQDVNVRRFLDEERFRSVRRHVRAAETQKKSLLTLAEGALGRVSGSHFALEEIFGAAMDFSAKEEFTDDFCRRLF